MTWEKLGNTALIPSDLTFLRKINEKFNRRLVYPKCDRDTETSLEDEGRWLSAPATCKLREILHFIQA